MATIFTGEGNIVDHIAAAPILSDDIVVMGDIVGVALTDIANAATGAVAIEGVFSVVKSAGVAWVQGDSLDWDGAASDFDKDKAVPVAGDVENCAVAWLPATSGSVVGVVKLTPGTGTVT